MMLQRTAAIIDRVSDRLGRASAWLTLLLVLLMALIVIMRYVFKSGSIALQESIVYVNAMIFMLGVAYTLKEQGHVRVDIFYRRLSGKTQAMIDIAGYLLFLFPGMLFIIYASWDYVTISWQIREGSAETSGLPFVYLLKSTIIGLALLLLLQGLSELAKACIRLRAGDA